MHTTSDSKAVLEHYVAAVQAGDEQAIRDCFAEDATWRLDGELPIAGTWEGREAILGEFLATAMSFYEPGSVRLEITGLIAEGDRVAMQWTSHARNTRGEPYENHCIGVFTVRDGRIASVHEYMDTLYAYRTAFAAAAA
jgi:ketosteroid isomerase-like protein